MGSTRSRAAADALAVPRRPSAKEASKPRALVQHRQMAFGEPLGVDGQASWGLLLAYFAVRGPNRPLPGLLAW